MAAISGSRCVAFKPTRSSLPEAGIVSAQAFHKKAIKPLTVCAGGAAVLADGVATYATPVFAAAETGAPYGGFGVRLTPDSVGQAIGQARAGRTEWRAVHPDDAAYLAALYERIAGRRSGDRAE
ncbi:MAG: hypothetical protein GEU92_14225 [Alphaproteobacteria bacterium]|nr:hypothetical protein [Alphaproteobacteria bacterium]